MKSSRVGAVISFISWCSIGTGAFYTILWLYGWQGFTWLMMWPLFAVAISVWGMYAYVMRFLVWLEPIISLKKPVVPEPYVPEKRRKKHRHSADEPEAEEKEPETTGQILKELGIRHEKARKEKPKSTLFSTGYEEAEVSIGDESHATIAKRWRPLIDRLENGEKVHVSCHSHFGSIRGVDVLLAAKSELKRIGYDCKIRKKGHEGWIWVER